MADVTDRAAEPFPVARIALATLATLASAYAAFLLYAMAEPMYGAMALALAVLTALVYFWRGASAWRFVFPGLAGILLFVLFPVVYTIWIGFTNYSSFNLLSYDRAVQVLMSNRTVNKESELGFVVARDGDRYRLWFEDAALISSPLALDGSETVATLESGTAPAEVLETRDAIKLRDALQALELTRPDGSVIRNSGLRAFAEVISEYERIDADTLRRVSDGEVLTADHSVGFFVTSAGEQVPPGWRVMIGWDNFTRVFTNPGISEPMVSIFIWTMVFSTVSVLGTFALGLLLAVVLQWPHLRGKAVYRILLILPYAVPSFISILVFRGLFNQNFGEINLILESLFGLRPEWFTDAGLARTMILIVNLWLGYPYMMLLAMGFLQGVPEDHKKAAALEGAGPVRVFFTITLPQILPPFLPLLIASFAFNFNNIVLVLLMTRGGPDIPGTAIPAGATDIMGSFTYRVAFMDTGTQFGLAGAITFLIFIVVGVIAYVNFVAMRRAANRSLAR